MIYHGDCLEWLRSMDTASVDSMVTDPPAGIGFMSKHWDLDKGGRHAWIEWMRMVMTECLRVLRPGAHALVWALPRTSYWTAGALDDAGFEIRDRISHFFGTGFPKSLNLGNGLGTALKPAVEDWWLCRKPISERTVAANVLAHGTGAMNVNGCRIESSTPVLSHHGTRVGFVSGGGSPYAGGGREYSTAGRWPANVAFSHSEGCEEVPYQEGWSGDKGKKWSEWRCAPGCAVAMLDAQSGTLETNPGTYRSNSRTRKLDGVNVAPDRKAGTVTSAGDSGGASRFFYVAKPSSKERDAGLDHLPARTGGEATDREDGSDGLKSPRAGAGRNGGRRNTHPTVKSIALMRWLCRLITPLGGLVLDPFAGSGSTGVACVHEGFRFLGIEQEAEYVEIAKARIEHAEKSREPQKELFGG